jgi:hypothetical protein
MKPGPSALLAVRTGWHRGRSLSRSTLRCVSDVRSARTGWRWWVVGAWLKVRPDNPAAGSFATPGVAVGESRLLPAEGGGHCSGIPALRRPSITRSQYSSKCGSLCSLGLSPLGRLSWVAPRSLTSAEPGRRADPDFRGRPEHWNESECLGCGV